MGYDKREVGRVLASRRRIARRVGQLAYEIQADFGAAGEITILPILTGAMIFCADLIRRIDMPLRVGLVGVSSYPGRSVRSQGPKMLARQIGDMAGRHVLIVDDILDSGQTIRLVRRHVERMRPAMLRTCVLLRKDRPEARGVPVDYVGFDIPDQFVVGYGLDYDDRYRNLPDIVTLASHVTGA